MKKALIMFALILALCGCGAKPAEAEGFTVMTTIFPPYDMAREIAKDKALVKQLLPAGAESHTFEPSPQDIIAIQNSDLFIYTGGESDVWIEDILASMGEKAPETFEENEDKGDDVFDDGNQTDIASIEMTEEKSEVDTED